MASSSLYAQTFRTGALLSPKDISNSLSAAHVGPQKFASARSVDLSAYFPSPGNQGNQSSCVAWASAYALKSYQEHVERSGTSFSANSMRFSPSFVYNQINGGQDQGSTLEDAGGILVKYGAATLDVMPYTNYQVQPNAQQYSAAAQFKAAKFERLDPSDVDSMKYYLQQGYPVVIGMTLYSNFQSYTGGVYSEISGAKIGGHAMCVVGYDDDKQALKLINSWGTGWGEGGYLWFSYDLFKQVNFSAMIVQDIKASTPDAPVTPISLQASQGGFSDKIQVSWEGSSYSDYYEVYRSLSPSSGYTLVNQVKGKTYYDTNAAQNTVYYYSVCAVIGSARSAYSSAASGFLQTQAGLGVVNGLMGQSNSEGAKVVWNWVQGASGYNIYRYSYDYNKYMKIGTSYDTGYQDTAVIGFPGTYYYLVTAFNSSREGPTSTAISVVVQNAVIDSYDYDYTNDYYTDYSEYYNLKNSTDSTPFLVSPSALSATKGTLKGKVALSWKPVAGIKSYLVLRFDDKSSTWTRLATVTKGNYEDTKPQDKRTFYTVVSLIGDDQSEIVGFVDGYHASVKIAKKSFADDSYFSDNSAKSKELKNDELFKNDKSFKDSKVFIKNLKPQDFFFIDEAKFFSVDPDFFKVPDNFFELPPGFKDLAK